MKPSVLRVVGAVALCLVAPWPANGAEQPPAPPGLPSADPFDALQKALNAEHEAKARGASAGGGREIFETRSYLESLRQALNRGEDSTVISSINQIEAVSTSEDVRRACVAVVKKVDRDHAARDQAFATEVDVAVRRASEVVLNAKGPKELDGLIADFNRLADPRTASGESGDNRMAQKLQGIITFLNGWQEYLDARARGDDQAVSTALTTLSAADYNHTQIVPRSEILVRLSSNDANGRGRRSTVETNAAVAEVLDGTRTLAAIPAALARLNELLPHGAAAQPPDASSDLPAALAGLQAIQRARAELQAGIATTIGLNTLSAGGEARPGVEARLAGLRGELIKSALPRLLGSDEKATEGEGTSDFLRRLVEQAKKRGDWVAVARGIDLDRNLASGQNNFTAANGQEAEAFQQYFAALNLEAAGQYAPAVSAYLAALKTGAQQLPAATIGEHLAAIAKAHPKECAEGDATSAPPTTEPDASP